MGQRHDQIYKFFYGVAFSSGRRQRTTTLKAQRACSAHSQPTTQPASTCETSPSPQLIQLVRRTASGVGAVPALDTPAHLGPKTATSAPMANYLDQGVLRWSNPSGWRIIIRGLQHAEAPGRVQGLVSHGRLPLPQLTARPPPTANTPGGRDADAAMPCT